MNGRPWVRPVALAILLSGFAWGSTMAGDPPAARTGAVEVGLVNWGRDLEHALEVSGQTGKPVFAFFQEVPGCSGCRRFGANVMSHPPIVAAIQSEFVPLLIYNNRKGRDAAILERFGEPAWNFQVVRFLDGDGKDLIPRKDRVWTRDALASRMIEALDVAGRRVPRYLAVVSYEGDQARQKQAAFAQSCFWSGEVALGRIPGVITTEAGFIEGREVTLVRYRPDLVSLDSLVERAAAAGMADKVYLPVGERRKELKGRDGAPAMGSLDGSYRPAPDSDQKRQIRDSVFARIDLSPMQRTKVNAFATVDMQEALAWLTPGQLSMLERLRAAGKPGT
jgi:hypothetical protein